MSVGDIGFAQRKDMISMDAFRNLMKNIGIKNGNQWTKYCKSSPKTIGVPARPQKTFRNSGWTNWEDFLKSPSVATYRAFFE